LHPLIYAKINKQIAMLQSTYCIISVPLLIETAQTNFVDRVLVIDCSLTMQITRVKHRDHLEETQIRAIINSQTSRANRLVKADDIIDNSTTLLALAQQVKRLHNLYLLLSLT
jgi:dephospho-CoA kinase